MGGVMGETGGAAGTSNQGGAVSSVPGMGGNFGQGGNIGGSPGTGGTSSQSGTLGTGGTGASTVTVGTCDIPAEAQPESTAGATVVGDGTPASCTAAALENAVQKGGVVTFNCGSAQATITLDHPIKLLNNAGTDGLGRLVIDGGNKVVLSGATTNRIFYQDACDKSLGEVAGDCKNSPNPSLVIQNLAMTNGYSHSDGPGGAIYLRGGRLKVFFSSFCGNVSPQSGLDYSGGAIYAENANGQVYIVNSVFGGSARCHNSSASGGAISGKATSFTILNSQLTYNTADSFGGIPPAQNTPGGGCGGAVYARGNGINLTICGSTISNNAAADSGGGIYYVADDLLGSVRIDRSLFTGNKSRYTPLPSTGRAENGAFLQTAAANITITNSAFN